jgi:hypothetical protein
VHPGRAPHGSSGRRVSWPPRRAPTAAAAGAHGSSDATPPSRGGHQHRPTRLPEATLVPLAAQIPPAPYNAGQRPLASVGGQRVWVRWAATSRGGSGGGEGIARGRGKGRGRGGNWGGRWACGGGCCVGVGKMGMKLEFMLIYVWIAIRLSSCIGLAQESCPDRVGPSCRGGGPGTVRLSCRVGPRHEPLRAGPF